MKNLIRVALLLAAALGSLAAHADPLAVDPFDPKSCAGAPMSPARAFALLGDSDEIYLSDIASADGNLMSEEYGHYELIATVRTRHFINGVTGPWVIEHDDFPTATIIPYLKVKSGRLTMGEEEPYTTTLGDLHDCDGKKGTNKFYCQDGLEFTLTDHCMRGYTHFRNSSTEQEEVYLLSF